MAPSPGEQRYSFIDGLRGIAVLWVAAYHAQYTFDVRPAFLSLYHFFGDRHWTVMMKGVAPLYDFLSRVVFFGCYGVDLFFVISGFLITGLLIDFLRGQVDIRRFYTRRVFKIIPHYYGLILLVFLVESLFLRHDPGKMVRLYAGDLVFLQNYIPSPAVILHTWSLVIEEQFYIFWAGFLWVIARWVRTPEGRMRWAVSVGVALVVLVNAYRYYFYQTNVIFLRPERFVHPTQMSTLRMDALMAGCLLRLALPKIDQWKLGQAWPWLLYALGISAFVFLLASPMKEFGSLAYWYLWMLTWIGPLLLIMSGVKGCFIVSGNRLLQWVGKSSYGIYLVHYPLLTALSWAVDRLSINRAIVPPFFLVASVLVGWATTQTLEKYFLNLRKRIAP